MKQNYLAGQKLHLQTYKKRKVKLVAKENNFIETTSQSPLNSSSVGPKAPSKPLVRSNVSKD